MQARTWKEHFFYRKERLKTTWTFRLTAVCCLSLLIWTTRGVWISGIGNGLACDEHLSVVDAILVDNFDQNYLLFERAAALYNAGLGARVLVPVPTSSEPLGTSVDEGIANVMIGKARLRNAEQIRVPEVEPISLNVAGHIRDFLIKEKITSVIVVTTGFRSVRTILVYRALLDRVGVTVSCEPVFGSRTPENWTNSWHGIQEVILQFLKLQYYRFYVLPLSGDLLQAPLADTDR